MPSKKYWEIIAETLSADGWTWGYCSAVTCHRRRWIVDAYRADGRRYIIESDELLSAFLELQAILPQSLRAKFADADYYGRFDSPDPGA